MHAGPETPRVASAGKRRAVLDIGTNSVKLLVADVSGGVVTPLFERGEQTRLGAGLFENHRLHPDAIACTASAARALLLEARQFQPLNVRAIATAAAREARNAGELLDALWVACALRVEILSGDAEADMAFQGVASDPCMAGKSLLVVDVGGGSAEFVLGTGRVPNWRRSFPIGTVRLHQAVRPSEPPMPSELAACRSLVREFLSREVLPVVKEGGLAAGVTPRPAFVAVGGTAVILARMCLGIETFDRERIEAAELTSSAISRLTETLWSLPLVERCRLPGLPPERADIILAGAAIFEGILEGLQLPSLRPSTRGLRYAALLTDDSPADTS